MVASDSEIIVAHQSRSAQGRVHFITTLFLGGGEAQRFPSQHLAEDALDHQSRILPQRFAPEAEHRTSSEVFRQRNRTGDLVWREALGCANRQRALRLDLAPRGERYEIGERGHDDAAGQLAVGPIQDVGGLLGG
jgi:hypothetical protein